MFSNLQLAKLQETYIILYMKYHHNNLIYIQVFCWGQNTSGQVGCGSTANQPIPRRVSAVIGNSKMVYIACGQTSTFVVSDTGEV